MLRVSRFVVFIPFAPRRHCGGLCTSCFPGFFFSLGSSTFQAQVGLFSPLASPLPLPSSCCARDRGPLEPPEARDVAIGCLACHSPLSHFPDLELPQQLPLFTSLSQENASQLPVDFLRVENMAVLDDKQRLARQDSESTVTTTPGPSTNPQQDARYIVPELEAPNDAPPAYGAHHDQVQFSQPGIEAGAVVTSTHTPHQLRHHRGAFH